MRNRRFLFLGLKKTYEIQWSLLNHLTNASFFKFCGFFRNPNFAIFIRLSLLKNGIFLQKNLCIFFWKRNRVDDKHFFANHHFFMHTQNCWFYKIWFFYEILFKKQLQRQRKSKRELEVQQLLEQSESWIVPLQRKRKKLQQRQTAR